MCATQPTTRLIDHYRGYDIKLSSYSPPGYPYSFAHASYGGPEDRRCGVGTSAADCRDQIDEIEARVRVKHCDACGQPTSELIRQSGKREEDNQQVCPNCYYGPVRPNFCF